MLALDSCCALTYVVDSTTYVCAEVEKANNLTCLTSIDVYPAHQAAMLEFVSSSASCIRIRIVWNQARKK